MKKINFSLILVLLTFTSVSPTLWAQSNGVEVIGVQRLLEAADRAAHEARYENRTETELQESLVKYKAVLDRDPENRHALSRLSLGYFTLAEAYLETEEKKREAYEKGYNYGIKSLCTNEDFEKLYEKKGISALKDLPSSVKNVEGLFWTGANLGRTAEWKGILDSLNLLPAVVEVNRRVLELNEGYLGGGAHRALGSISAEILNLSPLTFFQVHNNNFSWKKTKRHFERAIELAPNCLENYFSFAKYYALNRNQAETADQYLRKVLESPLGEEYPLVNTISKRKARELIEGEET